MSECWNVRSPAVLCVAESANLLSGNRLPASVSLAAAPSACFYRVLCGFFFFFFTFEPTRQLSGKQHVGQLALTVRQPAVVAALAVEVVEADPAEVVGQGRDHHDPGRPAALQEPDEEVRQQEVAWKKKKERWWLIGTHELGC